MTTSTAKMQLTDTCTQIFDSLQEQGISRLWMAFRGGELQCSHEACEALTREIRALSDFDEHEIVLIEANQESSTLFAAFVHCTTRGQAQGGVRLLDHQHYGSFEAMIRDGLRLARGMTEKNAMAEIWWGGGKGIICPVKNLANDYGEVGSQVCPDNRKALFKNYGKFIGSIGGIYLTAEDMNTSPLDMKTIHSECRFVTCLPPEMGGSSNPSRFTAEGVYESMAAGLVHLARNEDASNSNAASPFAGKTVLVQGVGNVGQPLVEMLVDQGAHVHLFDLNKAACQSLLDKFGPDKVTVFEQLDEAGFEKFIEIEADVFSPNAIGAIITEERIPRLNVKLIAGGANNQLKTPALAKELMERDVLYLPDFLINCMGIVNCSNEQYGYTKQKIHEEVLKLRQRVEKILDQVSDSTSVYDLAIAQSKELAQQPHPIWPGNGQQLIDSLIESNWAA